MANALARSSQTASPVSAVQLEKRIPIAARAMTEIGTLGERTRLPGQVAPANQQLLELRRGERRVGERERRDNAGSTVTMLAIKTFAVDEARHEMPRSEQ
jgi:hypothetical protein